MKKTLLASALMLAFAASSNAATYIESNGEYKAVSENSASADPNYFANSGERFLGGSNIKTGMEDSAKNELNGDIAVSGGKWNMIIGGHYVSDINSEAVINVKTTKVSISDGYAELVIAGTGASTYQGSGSGNLIHKDMTSTSLSIQGGEFGRSGPDTNDVPESLVVGGNLLKYNGTAGAQASSSIKSTNTEISGGTFHSAVLGASAAIQYYTSGSINYSVDVETANLSISGGTFNHAIVAGGLAYGVGTTSKVTNANLTISGSNGGLEINGDIYAGGMTGCMGVPTRDGANAMVDTATIKIDNAVIQNLYGTNGGLYQKDPTNSTWTHESTGVETTTVLSLTNVEAKTVKVPLGSVALRAENGQQTKITKALTVGADVPVSLTTDGATNDKYAGDISKAIVINDWDYSTAEEVKMEEGLVMGEVTMVDGKLVEKTNSVQLATLDMASALPVAMGRILMNDVRKRLGDIRSAEGTHGVWARYDGGEMSRDNNFENKFHTIQVGIDTVPTPDSGRFGVAFSYTKGDSKFGRGESDMDAFSLAAYGTWIADNGMFADVIGRMATIDNDLTIDNSIGAKMDNVLLSLSGEIGWRFNMTETFYLEPQAELTYTYVNSDRFTLNTVEYDVDATDSLIARIGFAAGLKCPDNFGDVYVRASAVHEFLGDSAVQAAAAKPVELDGEDTWVEFGIGANFNINKNTYVYADIERTDGAKLEEDWRANVGVRFAF